MPILIVIMRILDVSLSTVRVVTINKGLKGLSAIIGFFEITVWLFVMQKVLSDMNNPVWFIAYATGFALGTYIGLFISEKLSLGKVLVRVITKAEASDLIEELKKNNFRLTAAKTENEVSSGQLILSVIESKRLPKYIELVKKYNSRAFYSVEEVKKASEEFFPTPARRNWAKQIMLKHARMRKGK